MVCYSPSPWSAAELTAPEVHLDAGILAETVEVQPTSMLNALAGSLKKESVEMPNYVRRNVGFKLYYGSLRGAQAPL